MANVSIGLPVFNGEKFLKDSLNSILNQTYTDFELIICDNASDDYTEAICREYCILDSRIKYFRNSKNIGAAPNYNRVFKLSKSEYFKWCSHDDLHDSTFVEKCVKVLDSDSSVVLAYPKTSFIDENNNEIKRVIRPLKTDSLNPATRFKSLLPYGTMCSPIFGIFRYKSLEKTRLIGSYQRADNVLLARMALEGRFKEIDEYLFFRRIHSGQSLNLQNDLRKWAAWFDPKLQKKLIFPHFAVMREYTIAILESDLPLKAKMDCMSYLGKWSFEYKHLLLNDLTFYLKKAVLFGKNGFQKREKYKHL